jgi:hypothetical protein
MACRRELDGSRRWRSPVGRVCRCRTFCAQDIERSQIMMSRIAGTGSRTFAALLFIASCGGGAPTSAPAGRSTAPEAGATYLQGLHSSELSRVARERGLVCQFYGKEPGRLEYIRAVVTQSGAPKAALAMAFLKSLANARYTGGDPARATAWVEQQLAAGGQTMIGPASLELSGDPARVVFEIKAPGSEW